MKSATRAWAFHSEKKFGPLPAAYNYRSLCPTVGELVGQRLMRALGIGTAPSVEILETKDAVRRDPRQWVLKPVKSGRLKACSLEQLEKIDCRWTLLVEKIPHAIPLSFLRKQYGVDSEKIEITTAENAIPPPTDTITLSTGVGTITLPARGITAFIIWAGKLELRNAAEFYSDFLQPTDWSAVRHAIAWDSSEMLAIHAARLFLGCSMAHTSNVLVDPEGRLYSIDHEFSIATDGDDLYILFNDIKCGTRAFEALRGVAELTEEKVRELFEDLPVPSGARWFRWPLGSKEKTVEYFLTRLRLWKLGFEKVSRGSVSF